MHGAFSLRNFLSRIIILVSLALAIFLPRVVAGWWYLGQARYQFDQNLFGQATIYYEDAAQRLWWQTGLFEQAALSAWQAGNGDEARRLYETALIQDGLSSIGKLNLGDIYSAAGDSDAAITTWRSIGYGTPESAAAFSRLAAIERLQGNLSLAMQYWGDVLKIDPENGEAHYNLGLYLMVTQPMQALTELMYALHTNPDLGGKVQVLRTGLNLASLQEDAAYRFVLSGRALAAIGAWDLALAAFSQATAANSNFSEAWAWQGEAYQHLGQDGLPALKKALELDMNSIMSLALNGLYYRRQDQIDKAWSLYIRAATLDPTNSNWVEVLGELSAQKGNLLVALSYYQRAVVLSPQDPIAWRSLAVFCVQYNVNIDTIGLKAALQAMELEPENWRSQDVMGQVYMAKGDLVSARLYFKRSLELAPEQPESYLHLGYLDLLEDQRAGAYDNLVNARQLDPEGSIGWQAQRLLDQYFP